MNVFLLLAAGFVVVAGLVVLLFALLCVLLNRALGGLVTRIELAWLDR